MDENEKRKDRNKRMLKTIAVTGGGALFIIVAFTLLITFTANPKKAKEKEENKTEQRLEMDNSFNNSLLHY